MIEVRPAVASDIEAFYGESWPTTMRALVIVQDGKLSGVFGLVREGNAWKLFSDILPELEPNLKAMPILRGIKKVMQFAESSRLPIVAVGDNPDLLKRLGFKSIGEDEYLWDS